MGNVNLFVKDYANKVYFPHVVAHYPNQAMLESSIGLGVDEGGVLLEMGNTGVWGFFVERCGYYIPYAPVEEADLKLDLYWGRNFGTYGLGANIYWMGASEEYDPGDGGTLANESKASVNVIGLTAGMETQAGNGTIDAAAWFEKTSYTDEFDGETLSEPEGYQSFGVLARWWNQSTDELAIVPFAGFQSIGEGISVPDIGTEEVKTTDIMLGSSFNLTPMDDALVVLHVGVARESEKTTNTPDTGDKTEETETTMELFYGVGFEAGITSWLTGRFGANKQIQSWKEENAATDKMGSGPGQTYIGVGMTFGGWMFDVQVAENFLHAGPNFISGYSDRVFPMMSVTKKFK